MANNEKIIKYTIMPKNEDDDYSQNFKYFKFLGGK
jgi:hypothetical protein